MLKKMLILVEQESARRYENMFLLIAVLEYKQFHNGYISKISFVVVAFYPINMSKGIKSPKWSKRNECKGVQRGFRWSKVV